MQLRSILPVAALFLCLTTVQAQKKESAPAGDQKIITGTIMLSKKGMPDTKTLLAALKNTWKLKVDSVNTGDKTLIFSTPGATVMVAYLDYPIAATDLRAVSKISWIWPNAADEAESHSAQLVISVLGSPARTLTLYQTFTKIAAAALENTKGLGLYMESQYLVLPASFYTGSAHNMMENQTIPVYLWVYFGMTNEKDLNSAYTYGMQEFGLNEMEIVNSKRSMAEIHDMLFDAAVYVIRNNIKLTDGQTVNTQEEIKLTAKNLPSVFWKGSTAVRFEF